MFCKLMIPRQNSRNREQIEFMSSGKNIKSIDIKAYITFLKWKNSKKVTYLVLLTLRKSKSNFYFPYIFSIVVKTNIGNGDA